MRRSTGIELGPDSCVMVAARRGRAATDVSAVHVLEPSAWPSHDVAVTSTLKSARRAHRFPRRAAVIVWGLPDDASPEEPSTRAAVRPVTAAGFTVHQIMTPPQALAALAATRPDVDPDRAVAWMALNTYGVALAIMRRGELLFSRTFDWAYRPGIGTSKEQLLQRYALVSHLAPELQRGVAAVRATWGVGVDRAVTCGNLPELRSLTMPLIEELDLEVETLDSTEGLRAVGRARGERFAEVAPVIRLAVAAAGAPPARSARRGPSALRAAAALALVAGLGWLAYAGYQAQQTAPSRVSPPAPAVSRGPDRPGTNPTVPPSQPPVTTSPAGEPPAPAATPPIPPVADPSLPRGEPPAPPARPPGSRPDEPPVGQPVTPPAAPSEVPAVPSLPPPATAPARPPARPSEPPQAKPAPPPATLPEIEPQVPPIKEVPRVPPPAPPPARPPAPLKAPLPRVESILIDHKRRLAIIEGRIVGIGDPVGPRVVARIEAEAVVLREPSGLEVRVSLRGGGASTGL